MLQLPSRKTSLLWVDACVGTNAARCGVCSWSLGFPRSLAETGFIWGVGLIMAASSRPHHGLYPQRS